MTILAGDNPMETVRAAHAEQIKAAGGDATLAGRELTLSYFMQEWMANEVVHGTDINEALGCLFFAISSNLAIAANNCSRIFGVDDTTLANDFLRHIDGSTKRILASKPSPLVDGIVPATKQ